MQHNRVIFAAIMLGSIFSSSSNAQDGINAVTRNGNINSNVNQDHTTEVFAVSGRRSVFRDFYAVKLNCTPSDWYDVRITQMPSHGTAKLIDRTTTIHFAPNNPRSSCNGKSIKSKALEYIPPSDFKGNDEIQVETIIDSGQLVVNRFKINVR